MMKSSSAQEKKIPPAERLAGLELTDGWRVLERIDLEGTTGGNFSVGYRVESDLGESGYLKALDYSGALKSNDPARALETMTRAYNFERDILAMCRSMSKIVTALSDGKISLPPNGDVVEYLIFELADGDIRRFLDKKQEKEAFSSTWKLKVLHSIAIGLNQLHNKGIVHQDVKPSNVLIFESASKLADLGRASWRQKRGPHDEIRIAGDHTYAPPELLYGQIADEWNPRRFGCDIYLLGSMISFLFLGVGMTTLLKRSLRPEHTWNRWQGTYAEVLPYIRIAFVEALEEAAPFFPVQVRAELLKIVRQLCDPDPQRRGHPVNITRRGNPYSLERFISRLDLLSKKAGLAVGADG